MDLTLISHIKNSTIAIGLRKLDEDIQPVAVLGSGFVIDPQGYFVTASHVIKTCQEKRKELEKEKGLKTGIVIFSHIITGKQFRLISTDIENVATLRFKPKFAKVSKLLDIAIGETRDKFENHPYLNISKKRDLKLLDEIFVCGYPGGNASLDFRHTISDMKTSPTIQFGRIAAFMPSDNVNTKQGITTDIIGTGGLSGSPIVDANNGEVIGISLYVIGGDVLLHKDFGKKSGFANIGLVCGITNSMFEEATDVVEQIKRGDKKVKMTVHYSTITSQRIK